MGFYAEHFNFKDFFAVKLVDRSDVYPGICRFPYRQIPG